MNRLSDADFERELDAYDAAVRSSPDIDRFCSASEWVLAARSAWSSKAPSFLARGQRGYAALVCHAVSGGAKMLLGLDTMWGFACPLVGDVAEEFAAAVLREPWDVLLLPGIRPGSELMRSLVAAFRGCELRRGPVLRRWVASLEGNLEGYLARRSAKLRSNLRRAAKGARAEGITFEPCADGAVARAVAVERKSWKGAARTGLLLPDMRAFYEELCARLAARGRLRAIFAHRAGEDVGYILGGVRDGTYRGFQFSFDARFAHASLGALLQMEQIAALCAEGVRTYDLGIDLPYKRRWADGPFDTVTLAVLRS